MAALVSFGDVLFLIGGYAAGYLSQPYVSAFIAKVKARF